MACLLPAFLFHLHFIAFKINPEMKKLYLVFIWLCLALGANANVRFTDLFLFNDTVKVGKAYAGRVILPKTLDCLDEIELEYGQNIFSIRFASDDYRLPDKVGYMYKLEGFHDEWLSTSVGEVTYTNLNPGSYVLKVKAVSGNGYSSREAALGIVVHPPFGLSAWAWGFCFIVLLVVVLYGCRCLALRGKRSALPVEPESEEIVVAPAASVEEKPAVKEDSGTAPQSLSPADEELVGKAKSYVERNMSRSDLSVEELSRELGMSRVHLYKKLSSITGKTPVEFIRVLRLRRAARLLRESELNISEIAYQVGINNPKYFSRYFKDEYGMLPSVYQEESRQTEIKF